MSLLQQTLVVLKPDTVKRWIVGEVITRFEKVWLHLVAMKMVRMDDALAYGHYETIGTVKSRHGENIYNVNAEYMKSGPVIAMVWEGVESIALVRKMVGSTEPKSAAPGTIRGDYNHLSYGYVDAKNGRLTNIVHASATPEEATQEVALRFAGHEIHDHEMEATLYTRGHK